MKMVRIKVRKILNGYQYKPEEDYMSEEEFVFDSLQNPEIFLIISKSNLKALHLKNDGEMEWDEPDEEFVKVLVDEENNDELSIENDVPETIENPEENDPAEQVTEAPPIPMFWI